MPQLHFYVSEEIAQRLKLRATKTSKSVSGYVAELVETELGTSWPDRYDEIFGSEEDFPDVDGADRNLPQDSQRDFHLL